MATARLTPRIAVLLDHSGQGDSRVLNTISALQMKGYCVRLFTLHRHIGSPAERSENQHPELAGIDVCPVKLDDRFIVPFWQIVASRLGRTAKNRPLSKPSVGSPTEKTEHENSLSQDPFAQSDRNISKPTEPDRNRPNPTPPLSFIGRVNATLGSLFWHRALTQAMRVDVTRFRPDLILANDLSTLGAGVRLAKITKARLIYDAHEYEAGRNGVPNTLSEAIRQAFERPLIKQADCVTTVSVSIGHRLRADHPSARQIEIIPNAAQMTAHNPDLAPMIRNRLNIPVSQSLGLYIGSAVPGRGLRHLIKALSEAPNIHIAYIGRMSEQRREELDHFAREHNVSTRWHHLAPVPPDQIGALLRQADFSVIPIQPSCTSYRLCLPNKLFQSLAVGTPVLSTPLPEIVATLDGRPDGIITDGYDAIALARGLKTAHDQTHARPKNARPIDPDFGAAYGRAATDQRWQRLVAAVLSPMNPSGAILPPLPHAAHPSLRTTPRPRSEIIPKGWRRWVGSALIWLTTPWTQR